MQWRNLPGVFSLAMVFSSVFVERSEAQAYYHGGADLPNRASWMKRLPDDIRLSELSIPGTNRSAVSGGGDAWARQSLTISQQLNAGIRFLDLRVAHTNDSYANLVRTGSGGQASLVRMMREITDFLLRHPSETVLVRVRKDGPDFYSDGARIPRRTSFEDHFNKFKRIFLREEWLAHPSEFNPRLGELRGKLLILPDFSRSNFSEGIGYDTLIAQDSSVSSNWDLYEKWGKVRSHLQAAARDHGDALYINYLSANYLSHDGTDGTGGSFPYFVASGKSSPQTYAPQLLTGRTTIGGWYYSWPDFPRTSCWGWWCSIQFLGTNQLTVDYLKDKPWLGLGIIAADFPGPDLIGAVVRANVNTRVDSRIVQASSGRCIDTGWSPRAGASVQLMPCGRTSSAQRITIDDLALRVGASASQLCLDVRSGRATDHQAVVLYDCHGDSNQQWAVREDGRIESQRRSPDSRTMCLTVEGYPSSLTVRPCGVRGADQVFAIKSAQEV